MKILDQELRAELAQLAERDLLRHLRLIESEHGTRVNYQGRTVLMLSSNNYLGLAAHPALKRAALQATERYGVGAGASRLVAGSLEPLHELEERLARFKQVEATLVFGSGYLANIGVLSALVGSGDVVLSDELNHASLIDGCRLSRAEVRVWRHRDCDHLRALLHECQGARRRLIVTDSVFSMDGDLAPLARIVEIAREARAAVMIDEAHGVGVFGTRGAGLASHLGLQDRIDVQVGTLSKALGSYGAYVAGSRALIDYLVNRSRSFIFTTGLAPAMAAAASAAIRLIEEDPGRVRRLWDNASYLRARLESAGFTLGATASPILPVMIGEARAALEMAAALLDRGVFVIAIRPPTVPAGTARLRVTPTAAHTREDLDIAAEAFIQAGRDIAARPLAARSSV